MTEIEIYAKIKNIVDKIPEKFFFKVPEDTLKNFPIIGLSAGIVVCCVSLITFTGRFALIPSILVLYFNILTIRRRNECVRLTAIAILIALLAFIFSINELYRAMAVASAVEEWQNMVNQL